MKKRNLFLAAAASIATLGGLVSCDDSANKIRVWVGEESVDFYRTQVEEFKKANADFTYEIEVKGMDTGAAAGTITQDPSAAADIYTVAHDNIGKLVAANCAKPLMDTELVEQINKDNPDSFKSVIKSLDASGKERVYAAPYISQALFLYYNKKAVSAEQAKTFEGLKEAARDAGTKAWTVTGDDGFNNSFTVLARKVGADGKQAGTSVKIYEGATSDGKSKGTSNFQGDDTIASLRFMQRSIKDDNGFKWASSDGWEKDFKNNGVLAVIGGAWHFNSAKAAVGEANLGMTLIPTYTLTAADVAGLTDVAEGDVYRGGTFADCKVFMINASSKADKYVSEQKLVKFLSSKEVQDASFADVSNVPAYEGASAKIKELFEANKITESQYQLAAAQTDMAAWGIPQPFITGTLNTYYYSKNASAIYKAMIDGSRYPTTGDTILDETTSLAGIRKGLYTMEYTWMHGKIPASFPENLPTKA